MPRGYDTLVGERGVKLSGGHAMLRRHRARYHQERSMVLVLDEATSALDSETEKLIQAAMTEAMKGRTTITIIAHQIIHPRAHRPHRSKCGPRANNRGRPLCGTAGKGRNFCAAVEAAGGGFLPDALPPGRRYSNGESSMMPGPWSDPGSESLVLVGPVMKWALTPAQLDAHGIANAPQVAIDGGIAFAHKPFLWAGDADSGTKPTDIQAIKVKKSQDETDLRFCLNGIRLWSWRELHLFGFVGQRRDHEIVNFGEIYGEMKRRAAFSRGVFYSNNFTVLAVFYAAGEHTFSHHGLFSVIAFEPSKISLSGSCRFPAQDLALDTLSGAGISNEASGEVRLRSDAVPIAVFFPPQGPARG